MSEPWWLSHRQRSTIAEYVDAGVRLYWYKSCVYQLRAVQFYADYVTFSASVSYSYNDDNNRIILKVK